MTSFADVDIDVFTRDSFDSGPTSRLHSGLAIDCPGSSPVVKQSGHFAFGCEVFIQRILRQIQGRH
jgi:hypothetical protein